MEHQNTTEFGYYRYLGETRPPENPRILTRLEKGQALTHLEMDVNLCSLFHTLDTGSVDAYGRTLLVRGDEQANSVYPDIAYSIDKITKKDDVEKALDTLYAKFHYAPCLNGEEGDKHFHYASASIKVQHTIPEILYMISDEEIPGNLNISESFAVSASSDFRGDVRMQSELRTTGSTYIGYLDHVKEREVEANLRSNKIPDSHLRVANSASCENLLVRDSASMHGNLYVSGNLFVDGIIFGQLSRYGKYYDTEGGDFSTYPAGVNDGSYIVNSGSIQGDYSDLRLKNLQGEIGGQEALGILQSIPGYRFTWKQGNEKVQLGVVAQDVEKVLPEAVGEVDGYLTVDYKALVPVLVSAVRELMGENKMLWQEIKDIKSK